MEAAESPLEVLSRAAVMLQRNVLPPPSYDEARSLSQHQQQQKQKAQRKCKPSTNDTSTFSASTTAFDNGGNSSGKWKREKKYQHKTSTTLVCDSTSSDLKSSPRFPSTVNNRCALENEAEPLDMSKRTVTKERGEPPSYFQSILCSNYGRRQTGVPAVMFPSSIDKMTSCSSSSSSPTTTTTLSDDKEAMCDQVINEHFRRSLGRDYLNVFSTSKTASKEQENDRLIENQSPSVRVQRSTDADDEKETVNRCISPSPLSVDDHFAKALGETWIKLQQQQKQSENQNKNSVRSIPVAHDVNES